MRMLLSEEEESQQEIEKTRLILADDDLQMLAAIQLMLQTDFEIVATVTDGYSLVEAASKFHPDVVVTDISMPKMNGFEAVRAIRATLPDIRFIFLTMHDGKSYRREAQRAGAHAYVLKSAAWEELTVAVRHAMKGAL
jgi:DNA-binding NarL/FixJ family response regulator